MRRLAPLLALLLLALPARRAVAEDTDPLRPLRRAQAKRLAGVAEAARAARLGSVALRLFQDALALDPDGAEARSALGWKPEGGTWAAPDPRLVPGEAWPDDGEADLARIQKQEAAARAASIKDVLDAMAAARARQAPAVLVERLLWGAVAIDPADTTSRRMLAHREAGGRWFASEHEALLTGKAAQAREALRADLARADVRLEEVDPVAPKPAGWSRPVPRGRATTSRDAVHSLVDPGTAAEVARDLALARGLVASLFDDGPSTADPLPPVAFLHAGSRATANALLDAEPSLPRGQRDLARAWPAWPLGATGWMLLVGETPGAAADAAVASLVERGVAARSRVVPGTRWVLQGVASLVTTLLLGSSQGYASTTLTYPGDPGPTLRPDESLPAFVRRMVAAGADPSLAALAAKDDVALRPRDAAKAGAFLDWLHLRGPAGARAFLLAFLRGDGDGAARLEAAAKASGFESAAAMDEAWRRFVLDAYPGPAALGAEAGGAWKIARLERSKALPEADPLFGDAWHAVSGYLPIHGRAYTCETTPDGQGVRLTPLVAGQPLRVVRDAGTYPFAIEREYGGGFVEFRVELRRDVGSWSVRAADAVAGTLDGHPIAFLDLDCDGRYGGPDRDGYVLGRGAFVLPLRREVVLGNRVYEIRRVAPDGQEVAWRSRPLAAKGPDLDGLLLLDAWRTAAGVPGLDWDDALATEARALAERSTGAGGAPDPSPAAPSTAAAGLRRAVALLPERARLLDPQARRVGWATGRGSLVVRVAGGPAGGVALPWRGPVPFPPPGAENVPTAGPDRSPLALSLQFAPTQDLASLGVDVALAVGGTAVPLEAVPPGAAGLVAFRPRGPLAPRTVHKVTATWAAGPSRVTRSWTFKTGD